MNYLTKELIDQFNKVIDFSQGYPSGWTDSTKFLEMWENAKSELIKIFGGLVYEAGPISWDLTIDSKKDKFDKFKGYVWDMNEADLYYFLDNLTYEEFYANCLRSPYQKLPLGSKIIKDFKYFIQDEENLEYLQNKASVIIQSTKMEGILCFSVHPLDFLTISENNSNWRSCHALDGEYRGGNLSYMMDSSTFVCYVKSKNDEQLNAFPPDILWNNKKWRVLMFVSKNEDVIAAGRQYPFFEYSYLTNLIPYIEKLFYYNYEDKWYHNRIARQITVDNEPKNLAENYLYLHGYIRDPMKYLKNKKFSLNYNDLLYSSCYVPYFLVALSENPPSKMDIGGQPTCLHCNGQVVTSSDTVLCEKCYSDSRKYMRCAECGKIEICNVYVEGHGYVCDNCKSKYETTCTKCGNIFYTYKNYTECLNCRVRGFDWLDELPIDTIIHNAVSAEELTNTFQIFRTNT